MLIAVDTVQLCSDTRSFRVIALTWSLFDKVTNYPIAIVLKPFLKYIYIYIYLAKSSLPYRRTKWKRMMQTIVA